MLEVEGVEPALRRGRSLCAAYRSRRWRGRHLPCSAATAWAKPACCARLSARIPISNGAIRWEGKEISRFPTYERAKRGIAWVPQGRDIFPLLTVQENLETGFAVLPRGKRQVPDEIFDLFPILKTMLRRRGGDLSGGQQQQLAIGRALVMGPRLLVLDEPTEGIQPSIIKDIGRVIALLRGRGDMAILLVEQYYDFAHELAQTLVVMDRGVVVVAGARDDLDKEDVRRHLSV